jgi:uncharacterized protein (TIGR03435 family)
LRLKHDHTLCTPMPEDRVHVADPFNEAKIVTLREPHRIATIRLLVLTSVALLAPASRAQANLSPTAATLKAARAPLNPASDPAPVPAFEIASIHLNTNDHTGHSHIYFSLGGSHFRTINVSLMQLLQWAWDLPNARILGAPAWITSSKFDINAESDSAADDQFHSLAFEAAKLRKQKMVQALLADRFHLAAHLESRDLPIYALVVDKRGPKFSPVKDAAKHVDTTTRSGSTTIAITSSSNATANLAEILTHFVGRIVIDKTGIQGNYTLNLKFTPDDSRAAVPNPDDNSAAIDSGPSVFTALKEQLGLNLKAEKGLVDVLVVDHVELPSAN